RHGFAARAGSALRVAAASRFEPIGEIGEGPVGGGACGVICGGARARGLELARVLVVVAVHAQELPVAAVGGIVVVIMIAVMNRQLLDIRAIEFARASSAYPWIELQRLLA